MTFIGQIPTRYCISELGEGRAASQLKWQLFISGVATFRLLIDILFSKKTFFTYLLEVITVGTWK